MARTDQRTDLAWCGGLSWQLGAAAVAGICLAAVLLPLRVDAQSLAEVARQEEARRKAVKSPAKVYTNASLKSVPGEVIPTPPAPKAAESPQGSAEGSATPPAVPAAPSDATAAPESQAPDPRTTPEYWRQRIHDAMQARDSNAIMIDALQSRIAALLTDFTNRDDPAQRAVIATERQKALDELARRQKDRIALEKAIEDIHEEARRARIPPGWLR